MESQANNHDFLSQLKDDTCGGCGLLEKDHKLVSDVTEEKNLARPERDNRLVALEPEQPKSVHFGMDTTEKPEPPKSESLKEGEQPEPKIAEEDERFKKKKSAHKDMKESMKKEQARDNRINMLARAKRFWSGGVASEGWTVQKAVRLFSVITAYLLNLFTVVVIVFEIVNVVLLLRQGVGDYFSAIRIVLEGAFIWMVVKIHEKIEV